MIKKETPDEEILYTYDELGNEIKEENTTEETITKYDYSVRGNMTSVSVSEGENTPKVIQNNVYDENGERRQSE